MYKQIFFIKITNLRPSLVASCVISAAVMCMEAQYRRLNENYHGANSCVLKVTAEAVQSLKNKCKKGRAWKPNVGAPTVAGVLEVIRSWEQGLSTVLDNTSLRLKHYVTFKAGELSPSEVTSLLHKMGPVVGVLYTDGEYFRSAVFRGDKAFPANHAVTCTGYRYVDGELFIIIMDNVERGGPFRFVLYEAFAEFHVLTVNASS